MKRFKIALSFTGEHRIFVAKVAELLAKEFGEMKILYDRYHEAEFARPDLDIYLPQLYLEESELIVIFLCAQYVDKRWCNLEWRSIRQLISSRDTSRVMFLSFDELKNGIPELGIYGGDGYLRITVDDADKAARDISRRHEVESVRSLQTLEDSAAKPTAPDSDGWSVAAGEFLKRNVEFAIVHRPPEFPGRDYVLPVANGCLVGDDYVLTCKEALELATKGAEHKRGRVVLLLGFVWYDFEAEPLDALSGLVLCKITKRDERTWQDACEMRAQYGLNWWAEPPRNSSVPFTPTPSIGQECGFFLPCDDTQNFRQAEFTHVEFGKSWIAYFRKPNDEALKSFVTGSYGGRVKQVGGAVFSRDASLLGIISGLAKHEYDVGRRIVVRGLLGHPRYTTLKK